MMAETKGTMVIAVGGNSLIVSEDRQAIPDQYEAAVATVKHIVNMIEAGWNVVITHGSGPQVGFILRSSELAIGEVAPVPMDYADADIQGAVGYMFQRALHNEFVKRGIDKRAVAVVTQVLVDGADPAFANPTKPIGPQLDEATAKTRAGEMGWVVKEDAGRGWRRVVPSPKPVEILEMEQIRLLSGAGYVVIACGGGGIPVLENEKNYLVGVEAVIDKDLASALLAAKLGADRFIISTDVERVALNYNKPDQSWLDEISAPEAKRLLSQDQFDAGSMGPKVEAMIQYLNQGGGGGVITNPENLDRALEGRAGTRFTRA
ncbi:MAG: carbamate kinase [Rhodospirillales bacterium]|jgi:carbamate kinase|nr:carbamate kinase [Rhodospirillaceae bacterium]MDP6427177.1 carbamate kinase [Rhodospirillales bacterium]MDP6646571.1 carbamate kinase [Rhodospirillales bacterium]MDP6840957.1 carbamate kinase [Rhodospirillales bacterium]|tara:strand:- start:382 stop:1338 length:957 start_codon:yes stop_codon:yes gene_type:complete